MNATAKSAAKSGRRSPLKLLLLGIAALLVLLGILAIDTQPDTPVQQRPTARDINDAREAFRQLRSTRDDPEGGVVTFDDTMLAAGAVLVSDATGFKRTALSVENGIATGSASIPLPLGLWLNGSAGIAGKHQGFPEARAQVGNLPIPAFVVRWSAKAARKLLVWRGAELRPLDEIFRSVAVNDDTVVARLALPGSTGLIDELVRAGSKPIDPQVVAEIYCRTVLAQREDNIDTLPALLRVAFAPETRTPDAQFNRAAFTAVAMIVVPAEARLIAPDAPAAIEECGPPTGLITLRSRNDLAKHWALSAQLSATLGEGAATGLGEWKELKDSLDGGSGFSFLDLAADRSGLAFARVALEADRALPVARQLRTVTQDQLLPDSLMQAPEGLSEAQFVSEFGTVSSADV